MALSANQLEILLKAKDTASAVIGKVKSSMTKLGNTARSVGSAMTKAFKSVAGSIFNLKTGLAALAGIAGLAYATKKTYEFIDSIGKTSRKLGVAVEDLQRYRYAASLSGIETAEMDKALEQFVRRVGEAKGGTGILKKYLDDMGISLKGAAGGTKTSSQLLSEFMTRLDKVKDPMERANLAYQAFGRSGVSVTNMLSNGKKGLQEMLSEADRLGFVLGEDTVVGVEKANDAFNRMTSALGGVWNKLVAALAPALEGFGNWWGEFVGAFSKSIEPAISWINTNLKAMAVDLESAKKMGAEWGATVRDWLIQVTETMRNWFGESGKAFDLWREFKDWISKDGKQMWEGIKEGATAFLDVIKSILSAIESIKDAWKWLTKENAIAQIAFAAGQKLADLTGGSSPPEPDEGITAGLPKLMDGIKPITEGLRGLNGSRASGGGVMAGRSYLVGEKGPEIFSPNRTGTIGQTGGQTVINNIYTAATAHGINNALASRGDTSTRSTRIGMTVGNSRSTTGFGNLSTVRAR